MNRAITKILDIKLLNLCESVFNLIELSGTLLKPNMVTPGQACSQQATPEQVQNVVQ